MKALLIRIGIDTGTGGALGPIFEDSTFEYLPIPELVPSNTQLRYSEAVARRGGYLAQYLPQRLYNMPIHFDPEFETFTYGDPTRNKRSQLLTLQPGDFLVFYAGLRQYNNNTKSKLYILGYFVVAYVLEPFKAQVSNTLIQQVANNAHMKRINKEENLVIVKGINSQSRLLSKALCISAENYYATDEFHELTGYKGNLTRAIGRWILEPNSVIFTRWLKNAR